MIKGAIFDVDGTILDSMCIWEEAGVRYLKKNGITAEDDLEEKLFKMSLLEGAEYMKERYELPFEPQEIVEGVLETVEDFYLNEAPLKDGALEMLQQLADRGIPMITATSSRSEHIEKAFIRLGIRDFFVKILSCEEAGAGKQDPLVFHMAARIIGTQPEETYVFEDGLYAVKTAIKAGYKTVGIYDSLSDKDWEELSAITDFSMKNLKEFNEFWEHVS